MIIIKRDGREVPFNKDKIISAINKAFLEVDQILYETDTAKDIADDIYKMTAKLGGKISVEEIQDLVEDFLMRSERKDVARAYIRFRYKKEILRQTSDTYNSILKLIELENEDIKEENSNKNATVASTQRDYMAGEVSKDLTRRFLLPEEVRRAHDVGEIHFHDSDYFAQHIHNCFAEETKFITNQGLKSFKDFNHGDEVIVKSIDGTWRKAIVKNYGKQKLYRYTFYNGKKEFTHDILATENHRWILKDGKETTNLKIGDKLIKPPVSYNQELDYDNLSYECKLAWCKGFGLGDGTVEYGNKDKNGKNIKANRTRIRLCGKKDLQYLNRFNIEGCKVRNRHFENEDKEVIIYNYHKEIPNFNSIEECQAFLNGLYCADGSSKKVNNKINFRLQSSKLEVIEFIRQYSDMCGLYITKEREETGKTTNYGTRPYTIAFSFNPDFAYSYTVLDKQYEKEDEVWCLEVENTHNFILEYGIPTGNCCLVNLEDMLQNGTVINKTLIEKPHSFATACNIATQIMAVVASGQYGGQTVSLSHLAPFVEVSRKKIKKEVEEEQKLTFKTLYNSELKSFSNDMIKVINEITEERVKEEVKRGVQTIQYQINTLNTSNGQTPFVSINMYLGEVSDTQTKTDLALIMEEVLKQRIQGVKNEAGVWITPSFPKLLYVLEEDNMPNGPYWELTKLAAKCTAKRLVPDYISEKMMQKLKLSKGETEGNGDCYPCMGCRSFLTPDRSGNGYDNISKALNYNPKEPKYYGRLTKLKVKPTLNCVNL